MNMSYNRYESLDMNYQADDTRSESEKAKSPRRRRTDHTRAGNRPVSHNGIHRRRNKRFSW